MGLVDSTCEALKEAWDSVSSFFSEVPAATAKAACAGKEAVSKAASDVSDKAKSIAKGANEWRKEKIYSRQYKDVDGKRFLVCTCGDKTTVEPVTWDAKKNKFVATGKLPDPYYKDDKKTLRDPAPDPDHEYPKTIDKTPDLTHTNGIMNTPAEGVTSARELSRQVKKNCPEKSHCGCLIYTYSEKMGMGADFAACAGAELSMSDKVTKIQEDDMRRAINSHPPDGPHPLIVSAHSRGSIHTDNAWKNVRDEQTQKNLHDNPDKYYNNPDALEARDSAASVQSLSNALDPDGGSISPEAVGEIARRNKAKELAQKDANNTMNKNVHVVTSGNAVKFPDGGQNSTNVYTQNPDGSSADGVNRPFGNQRNGRPVPIDDQTMDHAKEVAGANPLGGDDDKVDDGRHHSFDQYYAPAVADEYCKQQAK